MNDQFLRHAVELTAHCYEQRHQLMRHAVRQSFKQCLGSIMMCCMLCAGTGTVQPAAVAEPAGLLCVRDGGAAAHDRDV